MRERRKKRRNFVYPRRGTRACGTFYESVDELMSFAALLISLVERTDEFAEKAKKVLLEIEEDSDNKSQIVEQFERRVPMRHQLRQRRQIFLEILHVRQVDYFLSYLSSLLYEIFTQRPETLRSSEKVEVSSILRHDSIESIVLELAERKVEELSYSSFRHVVEFFHERFGIRIVAGDDVSRIQSAINVRNISVHNHCNIDRRFAQRQGLPEESIGKKFVLAGEQVMDWQDLFLALVKEIDRAAVRKLKLRQVIFSRRKKKRASLFDVANAPNPG